MKKLLVLLLFVGVMVGCKDDDVKISADAALTSATNGWVFQSVIYKDDTGKETDVWPLIAIDCIKDDAIIFAKDGTYTATSGAAKCDDSEPAINDRGTWTLNASKTVLTTSSNDPDESDSLILSNLVADGSTIKGDMSLEDEDLGTIIVHVTLKKK